MGQREGISQHVVIAEHLSIYKNRCTREVVVMAAKM